MKGAMQSNPPKKKNQENDHKIPNQNTKISISPFG